MHQPWNKPHAAMAIFNICAINCNFRKGDRQKPQEKKRRYKRTSIPVRIQIGRFVRFRLFLPTAPVGHPSLSVMSAGQNEKNFFSTPHNFFNLGASQIHFLETRHLVFKFWPNPPSNLHNPGTARPGLFFPLSCSDYLLPETTRRVCCRQRSFETRPGMPSTSNSPHSFWRSRRPHRCALPPPSSEITIIHTNCTVLWR